MSHEQREVVAILFSDIKGFSRITTDIMLGKLKEIVNEFWKKTLNITNHSYYNSWGDAFLVCSHDPIDLSEIALRLRDEFRNTNWRHIGFDEELAIRIGLHVDSFNLIYEDGQVIDIYGQAVNKAARIEPIVDSNKIFCSKFCYDLLNQETHLKYHFENLGKRQLAKGWGAMELYELRRETDPKSVPLQETTQKTKIKNIKIPKKFTDQDLDDFLEQSFELISDSFVKACNELEAEHHELSSRFKRIDAEKMKCTIYINGEASAQCSIWISSEHSSRQILVSWRDTNIGGSYNDALYVENDEYEIFLKSNMGFAFGEEPPEKMTSNMTFEYLWNRFISQLR